MSIHISKKNKLKMLLLALAAILFFSCIAATTIGTAQVSIWDSLKMVLHQMPVIGKLINIDGISRNYQAIIINIRLPRIILAALVGASLAVSGTTFQGLFKNPMADPFVIGISSGAALGATVAIVFKLDAATPIYSSVSFFAFLGALGSTLLVYKLAKIKSKIPVTTLLLSGIAVSQFLTAIMSFLMVIFNNDLNKIIFWTLGSFATKGWAEVRLLFLPALAAWGLLYCFAKDLNIMLLGEESAQHLGVQVEKTKMLILLINSFLIAVVVSVSGIIGFVGLIIPHIARLYIGPDHRMLIPIAGLTGSIFMLFVDTIARTIISPMEIPVGIITAMFGGPFFIYLLRKKKNTL